MSVSRPRPATAIPGIRDSSKVAIKARPMTACIARFLITVSRRTARTSPSGTVKAPHTTLYVAPPLPSAYRRDEVYDFQLLPNNPSLNLDFEIPKPQLSSKTITPCTPFHARPISLQRTDHQSVRYNVDKFCIEQVLPKL